MTDKISTLNCPGCGAPVSRSDKNCGFCEREIIISSFTTLSNLAPAELNKYAAAYKTMAESEPLDPGINTSLGFCYLKLRVFERAHSAFEVAISQSVGNPDAYFYTAVCLLNGGKAFLAKRPIIEKIESYINAALTLEERPIFHYFKSYIKYDYYNRKSYSTSPTYQEALATARDIGLNESEVINLHALMGVDRPPQLQLIEPQLEAIDIAPEPAPFIAQQSTQPIVTEKKMWLAYLLVVLFGVFGYLYTSWQRALALIIVGFIGGILGVHSTALGLWYLLLWFFTPLVLIKVWGFRKGMFPSVEARS